MTQCFYPYCQASSAENYFRIPDEVDLRKKWMSRIPQVLNLTKDTLVGTRVFLCSRHFQKSCFDYTADGKIKGMKKDAVPSIFFIPSKTHNQKTLEDEALDEMMEIDMPPPPPIFPTMSDVALYHKVRAEELKLLIYQEKIKNEEEEMSKFQEQIDLAEKNSKYQEIEEMCTQLIKKMRPIAPKNPLKRHPKTLEEVIVYMKKERVMSEEASLVLLYLFADVAAEENLQSPLTREGFSCFAQYLAFYNTESFEKITSAFEVNLPPIASIRNLYNPKPGEPGWSRDGFNSIKEEAKKCKRGSKLLCSLLVAETSLKRKEEWDGRKMRGYVDCGPSWTPGMGFDMDSDGLPLARSVLVLLVVPLDPQQLWRVPVAYFYVSRLTSKEKANIIRECIARLHYVGSIILSVTWDVFFSDKSLLNFLGVSFGLLPHICPYFVHPADPLLRVHIVYDHCSLLTFVQNTWASSQGYQDGEGRSINWKFVAELTKLQETQSVTITQTFDVPQWSWDSSFIKNKLLAQLFSDSTANAIEYCWNELKLMQFDGCEGTVYFLRVLSKISKLLKSRRYIKTKTNSQDEALIRSEYLSDLQYLLRIEDDKGQPLHLAASGSIRLLYQTLMSCQELFRQVPGFSPHCVSLDEAELVFHIIKTYTGWSPLPTARQFTLAFTSHIEKYGYLTAWSCAQTNSYWWIDSVDIATARREGRLVSKPEIVNPCIAANVETKVSFEDMYPSADYRSLSMSNFIAICIVKTLADILHCEACLEALQDPPTSDNPLLLLLRKTCGGVLCPSKDVLKVCVVTEHHLQVALKTSKPGVKSSVFEWKDEAFVAHIGTAVMKDLIGKGKSVFMPLEPHLTECGPDASHLYRLVRGISCCYILIRLRNFKSWCPT